MYPWIKRGLDIIFALFGSVALLPLTVIIGVLIFAESGWPILFLQQRVGAQGRIFRMYKFRSMVKDAEVRTGPVWAKDNDPRVTKIGRWLRRYRLDEIPQLYNVLRNEMSLIGPRPERPCFVSKLRNQIGMYEQRFRVRPGVTGLAQIMHRYDSSLKDVEVKSALDLYYIEHSSFLLDMGILFKTIKVMFTGKGAH
jgi:lipopolysaccharide/colanic/teichoic acid biosynthesis glycosyltransferase